MVDVDVLSQTWWSHEIKTFSALLPFARGIHRSPVNSPHKGQWRGALMFSLICVWINGWANNGEAGDSRRHHAHYDVTVMICIKAISKHHADLTMANAPGIIMHLNELRPGDAYMRQWNYVFIGSDYGCSLFSDKQLPGPILPYSQMEPWWNMNTNANMFTQENTSEMVCTKRRHLCSAVCVRVLCGVVWCVCVTGEPRITEVCRPVAIAGATQNVAESLCNSFENRAPVDEIFGYTILKKRDAMIWL